MSFLYKIAFHAKNMNAVRRTCIGTFILMTSYMIHAEEPVLIFGQTLQKIRDYQQPDIWNNQESIAELAIKNSRVWYNPTLAIQHTGFNRRQENSSEILLTQPIDLFGEKRKAGHLSELQLQQVVLNKEAYQVQQFLAVKYFWMQILFLEQEVSILKKQFEVSQANLQAASSRLEAGSISKVDLERIAVANLDLESSYTQKNVELSILKNKFSKLWGGKESTFHLKDVSDESWQQYAQNTSLMNVYESTMQLQKQQFEAQLDYLKAQAKPKPTVTLGIVKTQAESNQALDQQLRIGLEVPLNIFNRGQYSRQVEEIKLKLIAQERMRYQREQPNDIRTLDAEIKLLGHQLNILTQQQIPLSESIQSKIFIGFKAGKYAVTDIQLATSELQQRQLQAVEIRRNIFQKNMQLDCLRLGIDSEAILNVDAIQQLNKSLALGMSN